MTIPYSQFLRGIFAPPAKMHLQGRHTLLLGYATFFLMAFGIYYMPIDTRAGFSTFKLVLMSSMFITCFSVALHFSKAMLIAILYWGWQVLVGFMHPETMRWSTLMFSAGLVFSYVGFYNLVYHKRVFTREHFVSIVEWMFYLYFLFFIAQQLCLLVGIRYLPVINLVYYLDRGYGSYSLSMEPSTFGRFMLVFYYAYIKCKEWERGKGNFTPKELLFGEHRWMTYRFLWMMCTMGSATAIVCLIAFCLYFVTSRNLFFAIPVFWVVYIWSSTLEYKQWQRATDSINAVVMTRDRDAVEMADGSGGARINTFINSLHADFSDSDTWFGHGVDFTRNNNLVLSQHATLFDDYGLIFYIISLTLNFCCAYRFQSLATLFMFMGVGGGAGTNIHYCWELMMIMTCVRYFDEQRLALRKEEAPQQIL